jgi:tRNA-Thr(GGU) m(6)t(6)A37 methyltransferase TsaA
MRDFKTEHIYGNQAIFAGATLIDRKGRKTTMEEICLHPIGEIRTPFQNLEDMPIQPAGATLTKGRVIVAPEFSDGLEDIEGFSHLILIYQFHRSRGFQLKVKPFLDDRQRGLFATRAPRRPNPIGFSVVALLRREGNVLHVRGIDVVDRTPLLDIKPYVPGFDAPQAVRVGWLEGKTGDLSAKRSDGRFRDIDP